MSDINTVLFYVVAADAGLVLVMGIIAAVLFLMEQENAYFWHRIVPATTALVLTSFAAGILLWIGDYLLMA